MEEVHHLTCLRPRVTKCLVEADMMPVVRIPDPLFERLQAIATPLVDSPASVIEKLLDFYEAQRTGARQTIHAASTEQENAPEVMSLDPEDPPDLRHTRIVGRFDGRGVTKWNELVHLAHRVAILRLGSFDALRSATTSNIVKGRRNDSGFHYDPEATISIQNVEANLAWRNTLNLARHLNMAVSVDIEWFEKDSAAHPGKKGRLAWVPAAAERR